MENRIVYMENTDAFARAPFEKKSKRELKSREIKNRENKVNIEKRPKIFFFSDQLCHLQAVPFEMHRFHTHMEKVTHCPKQFVELHREGRENLR